MAKSRPQRNPTSGELVDRGALPRARLTVSFPLRYPPLVDAFVQSKGIGFVGTKRSTMSHVAAMRVNDWNHGVTREVRTCLHVSACHVLCSPIPAGQMGKP